jgi:hypothetical protein
MSLLIFSPIFTCRHCYTSILPCHEAPTALRSEAQDEARDKSPKSVTLALDAGLECPGDVKATRTVGVTARMTWPSSVPGSSSSDTASASLPPSMGLPWAEEFFSTLATSLPWDEYDWMTITGLPSCFMSYRAGGGGDGRSEWWIVSFWRRRRYFSVPKELNSLVTASRPHRMY